MLCDKSTANTSTQTVDSLHQRFIDLAFQMKTAAIEAEDQPYGAVVVRDGQVAGQSRSKIIAGQDPTAHAEIEAIRDAAKTLGGDLQGCVLYSSSRACPRCEAAAYWAGIENMIHGKSMREAGRPGLC